MSESSKKYIYADNAASTRLLPEAFEVMAELVRNGNFENPSANYSRGRMVRRILNQARADIAAVLNAEPDEIYFTSGGTESDNWAIRGIADQHERAVVAVSEFEHSAVLEACGALRKKNHIVDMLPIIEGTVDPKTLYELLMRRSPHLVSVMLANNETGAIQPIRELARMSHAAGALFHTDAVQVVGHLPIDVKELDVDMLSASAHKFNGPCGIGFLYIKRGTHILSLHSGGGQEMGLRSGTECVPAICGMAAALQFHIMRYSENAAHLGKLTKIILKKLHDSELDFIDNSTPYSFPGILSLSFRGLDGETIMNRMDLENIAIATGAACDSRNSQISHVIRALHLPDAYAHGTIRISLSYENTEDEAVRIADTLVDICRSLCASSASGGEI